MNTSWKPREMQENFKENLNRRITSNVVNDIISDLQNELSFSTGLDDSNIFDMVQSLNSSRMGTSNRPMRIKHDSDSELKLALQIFLQKFLEENKKGIENARKKHLANQYITLGLHETANKNYLQDDNNNIYRQDEYSYVLQEDIVEVLENGNYVVSEKIKDTEYYKLTTYDTEEREVELKLINKKHETIRNLNQVVRILGLKKELVNKVKRIGYSGKSFDYIANIANAFCPPIESGYYMCKNCLFWKWNYKEGILKRQFREGRIPGAPAISEYEYKDSRTIVRTDYCGKGLVTNY